MSDETLKPCPHCGGTELMLYDAGLTGTCWQVGWVGAGGDFAGARR